MDFILRSSNMENYLPNSTLVNSTSKKLNLPLKIEKNKKQV